MPSVLSDELEKLEQKLKISGITLTPAEFRRLYELTGEKMNQDYGVTLLHNPCSLPSITATLLRMASLIKPGRLLNVGQGGYPLADIALSKKGFEITGIEYAYSLAALAQKAAAESQTSLKIAVADAIHLPFQSNRFDACVCSETLEHIPDDKKVLSEIHRILKPKGYLLLTVPNYLSLCGSRSRILHYLKTKSWVIHPNHLREYHYWSVKKTLRDQFVIQKSFPVPFTAAKWRQLPYENFLSVWTKLPGMHIFSLSIAILAQKKDE